MRVLALSPGSIDEQLEKLPTLESLNKQLDARIQIICEPSAAEVFYFYNQLRK